MKEENAYVERIVHQMKEIREKLDSASGGSIPPYVQDYILTALSQHVARSLIEGYSRVKYCTE